MFKGALSVLSISSGLRSKTKAFTLAEMLIALAIVGIIAATVIPKLVQSTGERQKIAKIRSVVSLISEIDQLGAATGEIRDINSWKTFFSSSTNVAKACNAAKADGCIGDDFWIPASVNNNIKNLTNNSPAVIFKDGTQVVFYNDQKSCSEFISPNIVNYCSSNPTDTLNCPVDQKYIVYSFIIDFNGTVGPNKCTSSSDCSDDEVGVMFNSAASSRPCDGGAPGTFHTHTSWGTTAYSAPLYLKAFPN